MSATDPTREVNADLRQACSRHPEREAVAENDMRTQAMCRECYGRVLATWRSLR